MPRIFTSDNSPIDFCRPCFPNEQAAEAKYNDGSEGPDGRGNCFAYDAEHPSYDGEGYRCANKKCRKDLDDSDN